MLHRSGTSSASQEELSQPKPNTLPCLAPEKGFHHRHRVLLHPWCQEGVLLDLPLLAGGLGEDEHLSGVALLVSWQWPTCTGLGDNCGDYHLLELRQYSQDMSRLLVRPVGICRLQELDCELHHRVANVLDTLDNRAKQE